MKKFILLFAITALISCSKRDNYVDISATGINKPTCPNKPKIFLDHEYAIDIQGDSISLYTEDDKYVGTVKLEGALEKLIILDNQ